MRQTGCESSISRNVARSIYVLYRHLTKREEEKNDSRYIVPGWAKKVKQISSQITRNKIWGKEKTYRSLLDMTFQVSSASCYGLL